MKLPALVLVTHDSLDDVRRAVASARDAGFERIVVVDAGSSDGTVEALKTESPGIDVLALPNLGYGACANHGVHRTSTETVVIANADVTFDSGASGFATALAEAGVGVVGPLVRFPDGSRQHSARRQPRLHEAVLHALLGLWWPANRWTRRYRGTDLPTDRPSDVDWVSGCCLAVTREAFDAVGGFDPAWFLFLEDVDLCERVRGTGRRVTFVPSIRVTHAVGGSMDRDRALARRAHARSMIRWARSRHGILAGGIVAVGAQAWRLSAWLYDRTRGRGRPSTGEDTARP